MPSHSHTFTPSGTISMNSHSHGLNNHTHSFSGTTGGMSANSKGTFGGTDGGGLQGSGQNNFVNGNATSIYKRTFDGNGSYPLMYEVTIDVSHTHSFSGTTGGNSGNTTSTTSTGSFSGTQGTTSSNGSGTAFNILPPYVVKYCFERTA